MDPLPSPSAAPSDPRPVLPPAPRELDPAAAATLRDALTRAAFDHRIFQTLGMVGGPGWKGYMRSVLPRLPSPACGTLARFFIIRDDLSDVLLAPALGGREVLAALHHAGLAAQTPEGFWQCPVVLIPAPGALAFSDPIDDPASGDPPDDFILPIGSASRYVDDLSVRDPADLAIDLGCGQGFLALRALTHARRAIATDINPRALAFARANAALAGATERVDTRLGSFFEPLADAAGSIDLLTCNPPFIINPAAHVTALTSAWEGDGMLEHLLRTTPGMLKDGGWATILGIWEHQGPTDWAARIPPWLDGAGCDALILQFRTYTPEEYGQHWFTPEVHPTSEPAWRALCQRRGIGAVTFGGVILRKRRGPNWLRALYTLINLRTGPAGDQLRALFTTQTALQSLSAPDALLDRRLRASV
ncbi:MAG: methyltransferase, partial [Phycisphaerales bacterium]